MHQPQTYLAKQLRIVDGDSCWMRPFRDEAVEIDAGFRSLVTVTVKVEHEENFRLYGCDTPERGKPNWAEATARFRELAPEGSINTVDTYRPRPTDKYGRWLVDIVLADGKTVSQILIEEGLAVPYFGEARLSPWLRNLNNEAR